MSQQNFNDQFPDELQGFPGLRIAAHGGSAFVAAQGAQVLSWQAGDGRERLYLSASSGGMRRGDGEDALAPAIRGGAPVCFPQFSGRGPLVKHGFVRGMPWQAERLQDGVSLGLTDNTLSRGHWPHAFEVRLQAALAPGRLSIILEATNRDTRAWPFTGALHTYFRVDDILSTRLRGLQNIRYQDATNGNLEVVQQEEDLQIRGEVDRVYMAPPQELLLIEGGRPSLRIAQQGFADTVVWNPGPDNARALKDFPDEDWLRMLCVEAAHAARPVVLQPGETWRGSQILSIAGA